MKLSCCSCTNWCQAPFGQAEHMPLRVDNSQWNRNFLHYAPIHMEIKPLFWFYALDRILLSSIYSLHGYENIQHSVIECDVNKLNDSYIVESSFFFSFFPLSESQLSWSIENVPDVYLAKVVDKPITYKCIKVCFLQAGKQSIAFICGVFPCIISEVPPALQPLPSFRLLPHTIPSPCPIILHRHNNVTNDSFMANATMRDTEGIELSSVQTSSTW